MQLTSKAYETIERAVENYAEFANFYYGTQQDEVIPENGETALYYKAMESCQNIMKAIDAKDGNIEILFDGMTIPATLKMVVRDDMDETGEKTCSLELHSDFFEEPVTLFSPNADVEAAQSYTNTIAATLDASYASKEQLQWRDFAQSFKETFYKNTPLEKLVEGVKSIHEAYQEGRDQLAVQREEWMSSVRESIDEKKEMFRSTAKEAKENIQSGIESLKDSYENAKMEAEIDAGIFKMHMAEKMESVKETANEAKTKVLNASHNLYEGLKKSVNGAITAGRTPLAALATFTYEAASKALTAGIDSIAFMLSLEKKAETAVADKITDGVHKIVDGIEKFNDKIENINYSIEDALDAAPAKTAEFLKDTSFKIGNGIDHVEEFVMETVPDKAAELLEKTAEGAKSTVNTAKAKVEEAKFGALVAAGNAIDKTTEAIEASAEKVRAVASSLHRKLIDSPAGQRAAETLASLSTTAKGLGSKITNHFKEIKENAENGTYIGDRVIDTIEQAADVERLLGYQTNLESRIQADSPETAKLAGILPGLNVAAVEPPKADQKTGKTIAAVILEAPIRPSVTESGMAYRNALLHDKKNPFALSGYRHDATKVKVFIVDGKLDLENCVAYSSERQRREGDGKYTNLNPSITNDPAVAKAFEAVVMDRAEQTFAQTSKDGASLSDLIQTSMKQVRDDYARNFDLLDITKHECSKGNDVYTFAVPDALKNTAHQNDTFDAIINNGKSEEAKALYAENNIAPPVMEVTVDNGCVSKAELVFSDSEKTHVEIPIPQEAAQRIGRQVESWEVNQPAPQISNKEKITEILEQITQIDQKLEASVPHVEQVQEQAQAVVDFAKVMADLRKAVESPEKATVKKDTNTIDRN